MIYTKEGDKGKTRLYKTKRRIYKDNPIFSAIGLIDEASSFLGIIISQSKNKELNKILKHIQNNFFTINSILAGAKLKLDKEEINKMEKIIDKLENKLPPLKNFILPGGTPTASRLMFARTLIRKAERKTVTLNRKIKIKKNILIFLNRLSDLMFILARNENMISKVKEVNWDRS